MGRVQGGTRTPKLRDSLIVHYSPLVKYVASRVAVGLPQNVEQADLVSYGMFGLIDAIDKFEPGRGFKFETYAISRIKGAILDELRSIDWVPRSVRAKVRSIEKAFAKLEARASPLADRRGARRRARLDRHRSSSRPSARSRPSASPRSTRSSSSAAIAARRSPSATPSPTRSHGPMGAFEVAELRQLLAQAINGMPEREKIVLTLYYYENLTLQEIGKVLGVTESRVCQIHTKAVLQLRHRLAGLEREPV